MEGTRFDHVKVACLDVAAYRRPGAQGGAEPHALRSGQPAPQLAQQQAVFGDHAVATQGVEEALQARRRNLDAGFERQREVGAIVFGQGESEQGLHACQQSGIAAQFRPGQEQRCRAGHL